MGVSPIAERVRRGCASVNLGSGTLPSRGREAKIYPGGGDTNAGDRRFSLFAGVRCIPDDIKCR